MSAIATNSPEQVGCQIYLVVAADSVEAEQLNELLDRTEIATVLIEPAASATFAPEIVKPLVDVCQSKDVAVLLKDDPSLARALRADGCHIGYGPELLHRCEEAREILGTRYIVGAEVTTSRHDAMSLGETGIDYVGFTCTEAADDTSGPSGQRDDMIAWWADIFEIPCVAFSVATPDAAVKLAELGADFVAIRFAPEGAFATPAAVGDVTVRLTGIARSNP